jgi:hypothetical protein
MLESNVKNKQAILGISLAGYSGDCHSHSRIQHTSYVQVKVGIPEWGHLPLGGFAIDYKLVKSEQLMILRAIGIIGCY